MNNKSICFIVTGEERNKTKECIFFIQNLYVPTGYNIKIIETYNIKNRANFYNQVISQNDSKYKVYINGNTIILNSNFIEDMLSLFLNKNIGVVGVVGAKQLPVSGKWWEAKSKCGEFYEVFNKNIQLNSFIKPEDQYENVQVIEGTIMATQYDLKWREDLFNDKYFLYESQCLEIAKCGYDIVIPKQFNKWCLGKEREKIEEEKVNYYQKVFLKNYELIDLNKNNLFDFNSKNAMNIINENRSKYEQYIDLINENLDMERYDIVANLVYEVSKKIFLKHAGIFASQKLEEALQKCADSVNSKCLDNKKSKFGKRRILHVLSEGYSTGGHTRLVKHWIESDTDSIHSVITTWQDITLPGWLVNSVLNSGGIVKSLNNNDKFIERATLLREYAYENADIVVLHIHMYDPIAVIAFGVEGGPPVLLLNHADHCFWIGASIADVIIDCNEYGSKITKYRRGRREGAILPIPLKKVSELNKYELRKIYNIRDNKKIILTIATEHKFNSINDIDYCEIVKCILKNTKDTVFLIVGPKNEGKFKMLSEISEERVFILGVQDEIEQFYQMADLYLDVFSMGSFTSELDAMLRGLPVIKFKNKIYPKLNTMFDELELLSFENIRQIIECINEYENDKENNIICKAQQMKEFVLENNVLKTSEYIKNIYESVDEHLIYNLNIEDKIDYYDFYWALFNQ